MTDLVKDELKNLFRTENSGGGVFLGNDEKTFAIFIGPGELNALIWAGGGTPAPRPLTHNLLDAILTGFDIEVRSIVIDDLVEDAFHATLTLVQNEREVEVDCRPSDALVVAVLRKMEVYVTRELFNRVEDGDMLLAAMREEIKRAKEKLEIGPRASEEDDKAKKKRRPPRPKKDRSRRDEPRGEPEGGDESEGDKTPPLARGATPPKPPRDPEDPHPEGELGDVRDVPGIDWGSLGKK